MLSSGFLLSGTLKKTINIPDNFADRIIGSSDYDSILGFALKFNDYNRKIAPLKPSKDSFIYDTTDKNINEVVDFLFNYIQNNLKFKKII